MRWVYHNVTIPLQTYQSTWLQMTIFTSNNLTNYSFEFAISVEQYCFQTIPQMALSTSRLSLLLFETYANVSSQICPFLALRPEFHSNHCVHSSTPRYCQSATFGRLTFCVYTLLFLMSPHPPRALYAHRANRSAAREAYMLTYNEHRQ